MSGSRDWKDIKYWIVDISKVNDTLFRGNFDEYHFERHDRENPGKLVNVISKKNIDLYYIPSPTDTSLSYPRHDHIIYFNAIHTPYRSPSDSIDGYFIGELSITNDVNQLTFTFQNKSQQYPDDFFVYLIDVTAPGREFPLPKDQLPSFISDLIMDMPGPKPQLYEKTLYADLTSSGNDLALSGSYPVGTKVTLVNHLTGEIFLSQVTNTRTDQADFWGDIKYSQLADVPKWENDKLHLYTTVMIGEVDPAISFLETVLYADWELSDSLHLILKKAGMLEKYTILEKVAKEPVTAEMTMVDKMWKEIRIEHPLLYKINGFSKELLFITYSATDDGGPAFLLVGDKLFVLPGECSGIPYFYLSNGILYLRHLSTDCGNGVVLVGNYAVFSDQLVEAYKSFEYSN